MQATLLAGFRDATLDSQACFRSALQAMSEPGLVCEAKVPLEWPGRCPSALTALALTLLDAETTFSVLGLDDLEGYLRFHTGAQAAPPAEADYVFTHEDTINESLGWLQTLRVGSAEWPETSSTLIVGVGSLHAPGHAKACTLSLSGPGIETTRMFHPEGLPRSFWEWRMAREPDYPLGIDLFLCSGSAWAAIPRSTHITWGD